MNIDTTNRVKYKSSAEKKPVLICLQPSCKYYRKMAWSPRRVFVSHSNAIGGFQ